MMRVVVYLEWPEECFRVNAGDLRFLKSLLPKGAKVTRVGSDAAFVRALKSATHAVTWHFRKEWYAKAPKLELVATPAAGRELVKEPDASLGLEWPLPKVVHGAFHGAIMSETAIAFALAWARGILVSDRRARAGRSIWPREWLGGDCYMLEGTRAVIAGYGRVGRAIGERFAAFGVEVRGLTHRECDAIKASRAAAKKALGAADWFVLALPGDTGTDDFLDAKLLAALPRRCVVMNVGRGNTVDEKALVAALKAKRIAAAYLDVVKNEPTVLGTRGGGRPIDTAAAPNLFITPHASAYSPDYLRRFFLELFGGED